MPTSARKVIVPDGEDCIVHAVSRCVRRAWLCGHDPYTGKDFEYRRDWVQERLKLLVEVFSIEVCAYAIMINHSHLVLWCRPSQTAAWSNEELAHRWLRVFGRQGQEPTEEEIMALAENAEKIAVVRERLGSVSWFMRCLNEWIARKANAEDECTGRFWEGRFKCQRLEDDGAVLACMAYVDLNPVRANAAESLEQSLFTSIYDRLHARRARAELAAAKEKVADLATVINESQEAVDFDLEDKISTGLAVDLLKQAQADSKRDAWLSPMQESQKCGIIPIFEESYMELVEWTGRQLVEGKAGQLPAEMRPNLTTMGLDTGQWMATVQSYGRVFHRLVGKTSSMERKAREYGLRWLAGVRASRKVFLAEVPG